MIIDINIQATDKQVIAYQKLHNKKTTYVVFGGSAGGGKSWLMCEWLLTQCLNIPGSKWFIGREELKRLMSSTYVTWTKVCKHHNVPMAMWKLNGQYNYIEFMNGSRIDLLDLKFLPTDPMYERFGSLEYTGGAIEEAGEVDFAAFDILKTRIGRHMNEEQPPKMLITCNPKKNWLYTMVYKPWKNGTLSPDYSFIQSLYKDNPYTAASYEKQLAQISNTVNRQRLMYGVWEYEEDEGTLFPFEAVSDMWFRPIADVYGRYMTVDVARKGKDKTVFYFWEGLKLYKKEEFVKIGTDETSLKLKQFSLMENIPYKHVIVDEDGIGGAVVDQCRGVHGFIANSSPMEKENPKYEDEHKTNYANLKAQCACLMAEAVSNHEVSIVVDDTIFQEALNEELGTYKIKDIDDDQKRTRLESKDEQKLVLGRSPDYGDAFIMRGYFFLKRSFKAITPMQERRNRLLIEAEEMDYDPHDMRAR